METSNGLWTSTWITLAVKFSHRIPISTFKFPYSTHIALSVQPHLMADYADREAGVSGGKPRSQYLPTDLPGIDDVPDLDMENESMSSFHTPAHSVSPTNMDPGMLQPYRKSNESVVE